MFKHLYISFHLCSTHGKKKKILHPSSDPKTWDRLLASFFPPVSMPPLLLQTLSFQWKQLDVLAP